MISEIKRKERNYCLETEIKAMHSHENSGDVASRCGMKPKALLMYIKQEYGITFRMLRDKLQPKIGKEKSPISAWLPIPLTKKEKRAGVKPTYNIRTAKKWDYRISHSCPIVSTEDRSWTDKRIAPQTEDSIWSKEIEVVKDRYIQPIKRIRIAAHSFTNAGVWRTGERLRDVTVEIAKSPTDLYLTQEDSVIISENLSKCENLAVGDKILGINGLKSIVCMVRKQDKDMTVNEKIIFGDKPSSHNYGAVKEMKSGMLSVFFSKGSRKIITKEKRRDYEIRGMSNEEIADIQSFAVDEWEHIPKERHEHSSLNRASLSPTLIPFLTKVFGTDLYKLLKRNAQDVQGVLKMLNMQFEVTDEGLTLNPILKLPVEGKTWDGHYWNSKSRLGYKGSPLFILPQTETITQPGDLPSFDSRVMFFPMKINKIYLPAIFHENATWESRLGTETNEFYRVLVNPNGFEGKAGTWFLHKAVFGKIVNSLTGLIAVPICRENKRTVVLNPLDKIALKLNKQNSGVVYREPVVSRENIQLVTIETNNYIPVGKIGVSVELQKEMFGDFDGDPLAIIGTEGITTLNQQGWYSLPALKLRQPKGLPTDIPKPRSEKEQMDLAEEEHNTVIENSKDISTVGHLTKIGFIRCETKKEYDEVVRSAKIIEKMKDRGETKAEQKVYHESIATLERIGRFTYIKGIRRPNIRGNSKMMQFNRFCSSSEFSSGVKTVCPINELVNKPNVKDKSILAAKESPYAKWIMLLQGMDVTLRTFVEKEPMTHEKKKLRRTEVNKEMKTEWEK